MKRLLLIPLLTACMGSQSTESASAAEHTESTGNSSPSSMTLGPELLHGVRFTENSMEILVTSSGCTNHQSFALSKTSDDQLMVNRIKVDRCKAAFHHRWIDMLLLVPHSVDSQYQLANPFASPRFPVRDKH